MADDPLKGFLTKTQAAKKFNRHKSTITRGINAALRAQDDKVLDLCKVKTADGKIHDGNTVAPELLSKLHNDGLRPVWYLLPEAMELMIKRDSSPQGPQDETPSDLANLSREEGSHSTITLPDPQSADYVAELEKQLAVVQERLSIVELQNKQLLDDKEYFKEQAKVVTQLQQEDNIIRGQTNELMKELLDRLRTSDKPTLTGSHPKVSKAIIVADRPPMKEREVVTQSPAKSKTRNTASKKRPDSRRKQPANTSKKANSKKSNPQSTKSIWRRNVGEIFGFHRSDSPRKK